jgi:hypothetical protein
MPGPLSRTVADDALEASRLLVDDPQVSLARCPVDRQLGHRERFKVAAHRRERRHQLVGDVRKQLTTGADASSARARAARSSAIRLNERATSDTSSATQSRLQHFGHGKPHLRGIAIQLLMH